MKWNVQHTNAGFDEQVEAAHIEVFTNGVRLLDADGKTVAWINPATARSVVQADAAVDPQ